MGEICATVRSASNGKSRTLRYNQRSTIRVTHTQDDETAVKKTLEDRLKSGILDCDDPPAIPGIPHQDCNCIFPPGQDSDWKTSELVEAYQDIKIGGKTYPVAYKQQFKYRVFVGGCYPLGAKIRWPAS
jgi:hypothetical protein